MIFVPFYSNDYGESGRCPNCHRQTANTEDLCVKCGLPLRKKCLFCNTTNELSATRCSNCGKPLQKISKEGEAVVTKFRKSVKLSKQYRIPTLVLFIVSLVALFIGMYVTPWSVIVGLSSGLLSIAFGIISRRSLISKISLVASVIVVVTTVAFLIGHLIAF